MRKRNNIFAEAFRWLKQNRKGIKFQKDVAAVVGVSDDTISRIMKGQTDVTDDFLCKFNAAFDDVFNYQWLRGEEAEPMLSADIKHTHEHPATPTNNNIDYASLLNAALAAKDETIASYQKQLEVTEKRLEDKDATIEGLRGQLADKDDHIATLKTRVAELRRIIDANNLMDAAYPFPVGAADGDKRQTKRK